jgi:GTP-binding protein Era
METSAHRCGYVGIFGRPNVGKSTFLNRVLGEKIAIVTDKPQTTRNRIVGIRNLENAQLVLVDTPGIHRPRGALNRALVACAMHEVRDVDLCLVLFDATAERLSAAEEEMVRLLLDEGRPLLPVLNKIDAAPRPPHRLPVIRELHARVPALTTPLRPISARDGTGVDDLLAAIVPLLPESPPWFPPDVETEITERFWVQEIIREKVFTLTSKEIPYATAVEIDYFHDLKRRLSIGATIYVEHDSQKGIIIGRGGGMLKAIGSAARGDIEALVGIPVYLELNVGVEKNWTKNPVARRRFGYHGPGAGVK